MNPTAIYSKSGKGVQEASGKTSLLKRPDRAVLSAIDGRANLQEVAQKCGKTFDAAFQGLITQLDKDGFIREISAGAGAAAAPPKPAAAAPKPAAKPAAKADDGGFGDLDFSSLGGGAPSRPAPSGPPSRPAPPPPKPAAAPAKPAAAPTPAPQQQVDALSKAREEAEAKAAAERERLRAEAEAKTRAELEAKLRAEAEKKLKEESDTKAKEKAAADAAAEAKVKAAREAALKAAEAKVKIEQEAKAKIEAERKAREETEKRLEAERKAREEAEKKAKEEAERARREAEEKARKEQEELKQRLEAERKAREEAERRAKEDAERARKELEEERKRLEAERKKEEEERAARKKREEEEAAERRRREDEEAEARRRKREDDEAREAQEREAKRKKREAEDAERERLEEERRAEEKRKKQTASATASAAAPAAPAPKAEAKKDSFADSLLADLDSFTNREEEEAKAKAEDERKAKAEAERRNREEAERQAREQAERERAEQEEARRKEEDARRAREEEESRAQEEERRKREADEIRRKAEAATAAAMAKEGKSPAKAEDIPIDDDDLGMDEVRKERAALAKAAPKEDEPSPVPVAKKKKKDDYDAPARPRRPGNWGKRIAVALVLLAIVGFGVLHVMPVSTTEYERAATEALGRPVKIGSARMWLVTGPQVRLQDVTVGDAKISLVTASIGSAFGERKELGTIELDGLTLPQESLGEAIFASVRGDNFRVERIIVKSLQLPGPAVLPKSMQADIQLDGRGTMRVATIRGPDGLLAKLTPKDASIEFDVIAAGFTLPIAPEITLSKFAMKGTATPRGMTVAEWGGAIFNGGISGTANIRWGGTWNVDGVVTVRGINAAVFAPALVSGGTGEGTGKFSMNGPDPAKLAAAGRFDGNFTVTQGTLGSVDLARAIQSNGKNVTGTTQFTEMNGQAVYDRGAVALRNVTIGAGALNAGASADIASSGALSGRIVADVKTASQMRSATLLLGGTVKEPQVRN
jgi:hypothetical protein